jgi:hypothetical protein
MCSQLSFRLKTRKNRIPIGIKQATKVLQGKTLPKVIYLSRLAKKMMKKFFSFAHTFIFSLELTSFGTKSLNRP